MYTSSRAARLVPSPHGGRRGAGGGGGSGACGAMQMQPFDMATRSLQASSTQHVLPVASHSKQVLVPGLHASEQS